MSLTVFLRRRGRLHNWTSRSILRTASGFSSGRRETEPEIEHGALGKPRGSVKKHATRADVGRANGNLFCATFVMNGDFLDRVNRFGWSARRIVVFVTGVFVTIDPRQRSKYHPRNSRQKSGGSEVRNEASVLGFFSGGPCSFLRKGVGGGEKNPVPSRVLKGKKFWVHGPGGEPGEGGGGDSGESNGD